MKAYTLTEAGDVSKLKLAEIAKPVVQPNEVLIKSRSISINPVDIKTRMGKSLFNELIKENPFIVLGWDVSGEVVDVGSQVNNFKPGDDVFGMVNFPGHGRAYAEYVSAPADQLALKPSNINHEEAAAATLAALTAWQALVTHARLAAGQKVVIQAASGGVGHYAVQLAKYLGAYTIATSSAANRDFALSLGADKHIDYKTQRLDEVIDDADFVLDPIGGENIDASLNAVKKGGTMIMLPSMYKDLLAEKAKAKGVDGYFFSVSSNGEDMKQIASLLASGKLKSHVSHIYRFDQLPEAHRQIETGRTVGKVVVSF
jgi:NADPH:quinone reductase-like Zn-dependent oxidoreductase